jgi:hypothetical protein
VAEGFTCGAAGDTAFIRVLGVPGLVLGAKTSVSLVLHKKRVASDRVFPPTPILPRR